MIEKTVGGRRLSSSGRGPWLRLALLTACFLLGVFLGQVLSARVGAETAEELDRYLHGYFSLPSPPETGGMAALSTLACFVVIPLLMILL